MKIILEKKKDSWVTTLEDERGEIISAMDGTYKEAFGYFVQLAEGMK